MSRLGAKVRRGSSSVPVHDPVMAEIEREWLRQLRRAEADQQWRESPAFGPHILAATTLAGCAVLVAIVVACVAAVVGDAPARARRPVGFDTITEGA